MIDTEALRKKVIELAIQGKLTEHLPSDGNAESLYAKIQEEKARLIKEGKIKKEKPLPPISDDEKLFDIPSNWKWVHLNNIATSSLGKTLNKSTDKGDEVPYLCSINVYWEGIKLDSVKKAKFDEVSKANYRLQKGDLLICEGGDSGRSAIWNYDEEIYYQNALHRVRFYGNIKPEYFCLVLEYYKKFGIINRFTTGIGIQHLVQSSLNAMWLPLPPLAEQKRIVEKLDNVLSQIDIIDTLQQQYESDLSILKSKIIDAGIRGKLMEQLPEDGDAETLYSQIQEEKAKLIKDGKIKKEKTLPEIDDNEIPFDIPKNWKWVYMGEIFEHNTGKALNNADRDGVQLEYITTSNMYWDHFELDSLKSMYFRESEIEKCTITKGDLLICEGGDIGRSAIWTFDYDMRIQNHIHKLRGYGGIEHKFYFYIMRNYKDSGMIDGRGIGLQGFSSKRVHSLIVPLPPIDEQKRIVKTIDELLQIIG